MMETYAVERLLMMWGSSIAAGGLLAWALVGWFDWRRSFRESLFE
jgi:hypothetical protein